MGEPEADNTAKPATENGTEAEIVANTTAVTEGAKPGEDAIVKAVKEAMAVDNVMELSVNVI